ncbi:MAG: hypothetical protein EHM33_00915 [Chloroflexi bacterium]|nr:MAG: hypothetical protein EHM33_00915 [Chloroflexota bacterium]
MTVTSPSILFGSNALVIKADATFAASSKQTFSDLDDLKVETPQQRYATYEPDFWILDGNYKFMSATPHVGLMSLVMSGSDGAFAVPPTLTITFASVHSSDDLTLRFARYSVDYADDIDVAYYDASNVLIGTNNYTPADWDFSTGLAVADFKKIIITFNSTNRAYRHLRLVGIDLDTVSRFTSADIKEARLVEEISPLSVELPSNTLDFTLYSDNGEFNVISPSGVYAQLTDKAPIDVYESVDGASVYMGRFYLSEWKSLSENVATFKATDAIGLLDGIDYLPEGTSSHHVDPINSYSAVLSEDLIEDIMLQGGTNYTLDASLEGITIGAHDLIGESWLPVASCRECLQWVLFRIGAYATCSRSSVIEIKPIELASDLVSFDHTLTNAEKGMESPVELKPLVTGAEITSHDYAFLDITAETIVNVNVPVGTHTIVFNEPHVNLSQTTVPGGHVTAVTRGSTWTRVSTDAIVALTITGQGWVDSQFINGFYGSPPAGTPSNVVKIDVTLVPRASAGVIAQRVYDYLQQRYRQKTKLFASLVAPGDSVLIDSQGGQIGGIVEKITTDLARGMVQDIEVIGVVVP